MNRILSGTAAAAAVVAFLAMFTFLVCCAVFA